MNAVRMRSHPTFQGQTKSAGDIADGELRLTVHAAFTEELARP